MHSSNKIETEVATFIIKKGILYSLYKKGVDVQVENIEENILARKELQKGQKIPTYVDVSEVWQFSDEARALAGGKEVSEMSSALAVVTGSSMPIRMVANFFMKFNTPQTPTKLFNTKEKALKWLQDFK
ncbi:MAG: STAS/SEC14 domain-containing protein [Vicingaceae bacterium]|nr:STAS/SEC14 domain-containing protein [Vicingaceae bacterium]